MKTTKADALSMLKQYFKYSQYKIDLGNMTEGQDLTYTQVCGEINAYTQGMERIAEKLKEYDLDHFVI